MTTPSTEAALHAAYAPAGGPRAVFSAKVADYVVSRPDYPAELFDGLAALGVLPDSARIADIGAGTGLLTAGLIARGHQVFAVEPNAAMLAAADAALGTSSGYRGIAGSAEATTLAANSVDLITAAQAFHWFVVDAARAEFLRILKPGGQVALIWNDRVLNDPLQQAISGLLTRYGGEQREALAAHEGREAVGTFFGRARPREIGFPNTQRIDRAGLAAMVFSRSYMPLRDSAEGMAAARAIDALFDAFGHDGRVDVRYRSIAIVGRPEL